MISRIFILTMLAASLTAGALHAEDTNPVVGKAGDFSLREADLDRILASQPETIQKRFQDDPQQKFALAREILTKKVIVAKARKEGFDKKPDIKEQLSYLFDNFITQEYLVKVVTAGVTVPEDDLKKTYLEHEKEFLLPEQVKVRHILVTTDKDAKPEEREKARARAESILQRIHKGEDFAKLAREVSDDQNSAAQGGELAPFTAGKTNSEEFEKAAFALKTDDVSAVVATTYGFHIIKMIEHREKRTAPFSEIREIIYNKLKADLEQKKIQEYVEQATKEAGLEVYGEKVAATPESNGNKKDNSTPDNIKK